MEPSKTFVEVDHFQIRKYGLSAAGDVFYSHKDAKSDRIITTLSDGLGSGIKANVLATLTSTMITNFVSHNIPIKRAAEIIMNTLPVSKELGISYATFTVIDINTKTGIKTVEYDNPQYVFLREGEALKPEKQIIQFERENKETAPKIPTRLYYTSINAMPGDRIIFFSDGVTQAGMGKDQYPKGWGEENVQKFIIKKIKDNPDLSARELSRAVVQAAEAIDGYKAKDDISCEVVFFRKPRDLLMLTGPPWQQDDDKKIALIFSNFNGKKIISGGTTAKIIERELKLTIKISRKSYDFFGPPESEMDGVDLVTEGIVTLAEVVKILETGESYKVKNKAAEKITEYFLESDIINFVVGTKTNDANYDPSMPVELEARRSVVKKIAAVLESKYLKEVKITFF